MVTHDQAQEMEGADYYSLPFNEHRLELTGINLVQGDPDLPLYLELEVTR